MRNKEVINKCKNFYKIINFEIMEGDNITPKLIKIYEEYILNLDINNEEDIAMIIKLDQILGQYIDDYIFRREFQKEIVKIRIRKDTKNVLKEIIHKIINVFYNYQEYTTRVISISRWI